MPVIRGAWGVLSGARPQNKRLAMQGGEALFPPELLYLSSPGPGLSIQVLCPAAHY